MAAPERRWKPAPEGLEQLVLLEDARDLLLVIAQALVAFDNLAASEAQKALYRFVQRRREDVPE